MSNLDIFTVLDGNVAVWSLLTDHVDWIVLVNNWGGLISRTFCKIIFYSIPLCLSRGWKFQILVHSTRISWRGGLVKTRIPGGPPWGSESVGPGGPQEPECLPNAAGKLALCPAGHPTRVSSASEGRRQVPRCLHPLPPPTARKPQS